MNICRVTVGERCALSCEPISNLPSAGVLCALARRLVVMPYSGSERAQADRGSAFRLFVFFAIVVDDKDFGGWENEQNQNVVHLCLLSPI